jgi:hypothetical protein
LEGRSAFGAATTITDPAPASTDTVPVGCVVAGGEPIESSLKFDNKTVVELHALARSITKRYTRGKKYGMPLIFPPTLLSINENGVL